jgi:hypothetical protein
MLLLSGLIFAGNINGGTPFVPLNSAQAAGYDLFSLLVWSWFFWSLFVVIRKIAARKTRAQ